MLESNGDLARHLVKNLAQLLPRKAMGIRTELRITTPNQLRKFPCGVIEIFGKKSLILRLQNDPSAFEAAAIALKSRFPEISDDETEQIFILLIQLYDVFPDGAWPLTQSKRDPWVLTTDGVDDDNPVKIDIAGQVMALKAFWPSADKCKINSTVRHDGGSISKKDWVEIFDEAGQTQMVISVSHCTPLIREFCSKGSNDSKNAWRYEQIERWAKQLSVPTPYFLQGYQILYGLVSIMQPTMIRLRSARTESLGEACQHNQ